VRADGSVDSRRSSNDIVSLQRIVPTAVTGGGNIFPNVWNTTDKQRSFPVVNSQEISIIIIIELLRNRKYCEMYRLAWLTYWGRSVWSVSSELLHHGWGSWEYFDIAAERSDFWGKIRHFKPYQKILQRLWIIRTAWTWFTERLQATLKVYITNAVWNNSGKMKATKHRPQLYSIKLLAPELFFNFSTPCI
jgi:hypothetical protein